MRLSALARLFGAATTPTHRALDDARATVDVLHALIERVGNQGVHTYTDLRAYLPDVSPRTAPQAACLPPTSRAGPASICSAAPPTRCSTSAPRSICAAGSASTSTAPIRAPASRRWSPLATARRPRRMRTRTGGGRARTAAARRARPAVQPPVEVPAPVVVDRADRRGVSAVLGRAKPQGRQCRRTVPGPRRRRRDRRSARPVHRRAHLHRHGSARSARHGPACPERELSPCPARRDVAAAGYAEAPRRAAAADRRRRGRGAVGGAGPHRRARRLRPLRDRRPAARPRRRRDRRAVARSAAARAGRCRPNWSRHAPTAAADGTSLSSAAGSSPLRVSHRGAYRRCRWSMR